MGVFNEDIAAMVKDKAENRTLQYQQTLVSFTDLGLSRVEGFHGCLFDWRTGAAGACSAVSWTRIAGECTAPVSNISIQNQIRYLFFYFKIRRKGFGVLSLL